ncbi:MAG: protein kinase [Rhodothermales bacterium]
MMTGSTLSHYQILHELGRGGMGVVYKAQDTKLDRMVAIKVLPPGALSTDDDRARFYREAKAAAALNHPHIAQIYEIDEVDGTPFIAMEFIDGPMLSEEVKRGPMKLEDVIRIALQIAGALGAAHAKDIVHRDIKSANIMLAGDGAVKVLDFGLAKTQQSTQLTRMGSTLGTVAYMSPEQARGDEVDGRTDLYSLGTVIYEMVAGRLPFGGEYEQAVVYGILNEMPEPLTAVRTGVPMELERIVFKALAKDKEIRYQTASGIIADLKALAIGASGVSRRSVPAMSGVASPSGVSAAPASAIETSIPRGASAPAASRLPVWIWAALPILLVAGLAIGWKVGPVGTDSNTSSAVLRARLHLPDAGSPLRADITPDNRFVFYAAVNPTRILAYDLATATIREVERSANGVRPHVSPDGRWVYFFNNTEARWWRAPVSGGVAAPVIGGETNRLMSPGFTAAGGFVFTDSTWGLSGVDENGRVTKIADLDTLDGPTGLFNLVTAPGGSFSLYTTLAPGLVPVRVTKLEDDKDATEYLPSVYAHAITPTGHLLTIQEALSAPSPQTYATPINLKTGAVEGATVALGARSFPAVVSPSGVLVYEELGDQSGQSVPSTLYRISSTGNPERQATLPGAMSSEFSISGDGSRVVVSAIPELRQQADVYIMDLERETVTRLTREGGYDLPVWGAGDRTVYFDQQRADGWVILRRNADGSGANEVILPDIPDIGDQALTPDGRYMVFNNGPLDLYVHDFQTESTRLVLDVAENLTKPTLSPDGTYVAFLRGGSSWCGSLEVVSLDGTGEPIQIVEQGCMPKWSPDGSAIFSEYQGTITRTPVTTEPTFRQLGPSEVVFTGPSGFQTGTDGALYFDVDAGGNVWVAYPESQGERGEIWLVVNWFEELNRLAPRDLK